MPEEEEEAEEAEEKGGDIRRRGGLVGGAGCGRCGEKGKWRTTYKAWRADNWGPLRVVGQ
jgi:hypothetical protein